MVLALIGGSVIGIAVSLMLVFNGRVTGISGIISGTLVPNKHDLWWRVFFITGLIAGGVVLKFTHPQSFESLSQNMSTLDYAVAGLLVGFGTLLGNGCTSGHGVCGISRLSIRSIVATGVFITFGIASVLLFKYFKGEL